ncbi:MAG: glycosyltransferase family 2 protein [Deltaproteobacteria bacterium]|nr:glycosyltransferase family 2 protein [Deltaproteobacteria bacterium]
MESTVSVIIPTYNTAKYVLEAIDSVLAQSYKDLEIIVVDDGSTDNTYEVIKQYYANNIRDVQLIEVINPFEQTKLAERTQRTQLIYIHQENRGRAGARNTGIRAARGKYLAFLDSDDLWTPGKLAKQVDIMDGNKNIDFLFGDKQRFSDDGTITISSMFTEKGYDENFFGDPLYVRNAYKKLLQEPYIPTGTVIMKKGCFDRSGLFDETIYVEDFEFWLRSALFNNLAYSTDLWELERDREGSGSKNLKAVYLSRIGILEKHEREFGDNLSELNIDLNPKIREACTNSGYFFLGNETSLARECFKKSLSRGLDVRTLIYWLSTFFGTSLIKKLQRLRN